MDLNNEGPTGGGAVPPFLAGRYVLSREIAHGGMGSVWLAHDEQTGRPVAVKFQTATWNERSFQREVAALRRISHEHVVRILDAGHDAGRSFIVMELLRGVTLSTRLRGGKVLSLEEAGSLLTQAAHGLAAAHGAGVVHRDIKPSNLFLAETARGTQVKVLDFGIARPVVLEVDASVSALVGSPAYMSPEQARGLVVDERADLWALSVVAFKMLTGTEPFSAGDLPATLQRICEGRARALRELRPDLPEALTGFFKRAFSVDVAWRFRTATELSAAFASARDDRTSWSVGRTEQTTPIDPVELRAAAIEAGAGASKARSYWLAPLAAVAVGGVLWMAGVFPVQGRLRNVAAQPAAPREPTLAASRAKPPVSAPHDRPVTSPAAPPLAPSTLSAVEASAASAARVNQPRKPAAAPRLREVPTATPVAETVTPPASAAPPVTDPLDRRF